MRTSAFQRVFAAVLLASAAFASVPGRASTEDCTATTASGAGCTGTVRFGWVSPAGAETLNFATSNGMFGYGIHPSPDASSWAGRCFTLSNTKNPNADFDVYFYTPDANPNDCDSNTWECHNTQGTGGEHGAIPPGTTYAMVLIAPVSTPFPYDVPDANWTPEKLDVPFKFVVYPKPSSGQC